MLPPRTRERPSGAPPSNQPPSASHTLPFPQGFPSHVRQPDDDGMGGVAGSDGASSPAEDRTAMLNLAFAWGLVAFCCLHHAGHLLHDLGMHSVAHLPVLHAMGAPRAPTFLRLGFFYVPCIPSARLSPINTPLPHTIFNAQTPAGSPDGKQ